MFILNKKEINDTLILTIDNSFLDIETVYKSGQCFNITRDENIYKVISKQKLCILKKYKENTEIYLKKDDEDYWSNYFNFDINFKQYLNILKEDENIFIKKCANFSPGMIILKQDLWECTISFIISQRKSIPSIITSLDLLTKYFGKQHKIILEEFGVIKYKSLPQIEDFTWFTKNNQKEKILSYLHLKNNKKELPDFIIPNELQNFMNCGLGYRDEYILHAVEWFSQKKEILPGYCNHINSLMEIKGVGNKVANCISLFSFNDFSAFPVDVWIKRILDKKLLPKDLSQYQEFLGFLQQIVFYYSIQNKQEIL